MLFSVHPSWMHPHTEPILTHNPVIVSFFFMLESQILCLIIIFFHFIEVNRAHHLFQSPNNIIAAPKPQCQPLLSTFLHFFFTLLQVSWMKCRLVFVSARACLNSRTEWKWIKHDHILSHILGGQSQEFEGKQKTFPLFSQQCGFKGNETTSMLPSAVTWFGNTWCNNWKKNRLHLCAQWSFNPYIGLRIMQVNFLHWQIFKFTWTYLTMKISILRPLLFKE